EMEFPKSNWLSLYVRYHCVMTPGDEHVFRELMRKGWDPVIVADRLALGLARARMRLALPLARAAARFLEDRGWERFGFARLEDHAHERFGRSGRWLRDLRSLHETAERLPSLAA